MISTILSIVATFVSVGSYVMYDRKLKKFALQQAERDAAAAKSADIVVEFSKSSNEFLVRNNGRVAAEEVMVDIDSAIIFMPGQFPFPMRLESGQTVPVSIYRSIGGPVRTMVKVNWKDSLRPLGTEKSFDIPLFS